MQSSFLDALKNRRTHYALTNKSTISDDAIVTLLQEAAMASPSAFHSQSSSIMLLLGDNHAKLWGIAMEALRKIVPAEHFQATEDKINSFAAGYGTVLYFDDQSVTKGLQAQFPTYKDNFPIWADQSNGMLQLCVWTLLEEAGLGASLQHYTELIEETAKKEFGVNENWKLVAQMPFGTPTATPTPKTFKSVTERVIVKK